MTPRFPATLAALEPMAVPLATAAPAAILPTLKGRSS
jgi:hypothetical protein